MLVYVKDCYKHVEEKDRLIYEKNDWNLIFRRYYHRYYHLK